MDQRLTLQQMRVLVALYTFRNRNTEMAHPTREEIRERTGMALPKISTATSDLERLGWLTKTGNGGRSQATRYRVHVPETDPNSVTVTEPVTAPKQVTVPESVTVTESAPNPSRIGNETVPESGRGKEQTIQTRTDKKTVRVTAPTFVLPDWINKSHWDVWHSCAKRKNASDAQKQMAVDKMDAWRQQGIDYAAALENAAIAGWQGLFKPDVPAAAMTPGRRDSGETPYQRSMRERMQEAVPSIARRAPEPPQDAADFFRTVDAQSRVVDVKAIEVTP